jgi:hypothetical protein
MAEIVTLQAHARPAAEAFAGFYAEDFAGELEIPHLKKCAR